MSNPQFLQALAEAWNNMVETTFPGEAVGHRSSQVVADFHEGDLRGLSHDELDVFRVTLDDLRISRLDGSAAAGRPTTVVGDDMVLWLSFWLLEGQGNFHVQYNHHTDGHPGPLGTYVPRYDYHENWWGTFTQTYRNSAVAVWVSVSDNNLTFKGTYIGVQVPLLLPGAGGMQLTPVPQIPDSLSLSFTDGGVDDQVGSLAAKGIQKLAGGWVSEIFSGILRKKLGV